MSAHTLEQFASMPVTGPTFAEYWGAEDRRVVGERRASQRLVNGSGGDRRRHDIARISDRAIIRGLGDLSAEGDHLFKGHESADYYIGILALNDVSVVPDALEDYYRMRAKTYIDEMGFLPPEARNEKGGETDADDSRSVHLGVLWNLGQDIAPQVVGTSRLIIKRTEEDTLPVERLFPEAFPEGNAPKSSFEVSRYIARHPDKTARKIVSLGLIRAIVGYTMAFEYGPAHAVIEKPLGRMFSAIRLPYTKLAQEKMVDEYNTVNFPVLIDPRQVLDTIKPENHVHSSPVMREFFKRTTEDMGFGFFDASLTKDR